MSFNQEVARRRTFAIISHPDAGKTTLTERLLLSGGAIQQAGNVKARKSGRHATSDWMEMEKQRGISVTSSVMQYEYDDKIINLLDTPGHADFSEDTYRTLTAVDSALMVIDIAKGVEERTIKLMDVCRLRTTPIMTFVNKMDREGRDPIEVMDEVESVLDILCAPMTWPIGTGKGFRGVYRIYDDTIHLFAGRPDNGEEDEFLKGIDSDEVSDRLGLLADDLREELELLQGASNEFDLELYLEGQLTPVFFGSAIANLGVEELMATFAEHAPAPQGRETETRTVDSNEEKFSGFVFKIQANMDPSHHDRIAFLRVNSGQFSKGKKFRHVRLERDMAINNASSFMASRRDQAEEAYAGDIIGIHNHGTIQIGDTFTEGEMLKFTGIPNFAPELFRRVRLNDPLRAKALQKGLIQLSEEGATQVFRPINNNDLILGAVGILQFDVVAHRLKAEYKVECGFEAVHVALDGADELTYVAPNMVNLQLTQERWPDVVFNTTKEI